MTQTREKHSHFRLDNRVCCARYGPSRTHILHVRVCSSIFRVPLPCIKVFAHEIREELQARGDKCSTSEHAQRTQDKKPISNFIKDSVRSEIDKTPTMSEKDAATMGEKHVPGVVLRGRSCRLGNRQSHMKLDRVTPRLVKVRGNAQTRAVAPELRPRLALREGRRQLENMRVGRHPHAA